MPVRAGRARIGTETPPPGEEALDLASPTIMYSRPDVATASDAPHSVTVIIVNWNSGELLARCLRHLSTQTVRPQSILLVDNHSTDGSLALARAFPGVTVLPMPENLGFAAGNNRGLAHCQTEFVALLNPDAFAEPDWLERLLEQTSLHPEAAFFGSRQMAHGSKGVLDGVGDKYHLSGLLWRHRHGRPQEAVDLLPGEIFSPCACAALYRRRALLEVGGFDEDYFCYAEDVDLGFRLRLAGHQAMYAPKAVVHHVGSAITGGKRSDFSVYHGQRNLVWTFVKDMPGALFWLLLPLHLLLNLTFLGLFSLRGQGRVICRAKWHALRGLPSMWKKRRVVQAARRVRIADIWRVMDKSLLPHK